MNNPKNGGCADEDLPVTLSRLDQNATLQEKLEKAGQTVNVSGEDEADFEALLQTLRQRNTQLQDEKQSLELLFQISRNLVTVAEPHIVAQNALEAITKALDVLRGEVFELDQESGRLRMLALIGYDDEAVSLYEASAELRLQQGLAWHAAQNKEAIAVPDVNCSQHWVPIPGLDDQICSAAVVPLIADDKMSGMLSLLSDQGGHLNRSRLPLLIAAASPIALALQNAKLFVAEIEARQAAETLRLASLELTKTFDLEVMTANALEFLRQVTGYDQAAVLLFQGDQALITAYQSYETEVEPRPLSGQELPLDRYPFLQQIIQTQEPLFITDTLEEPAWQPVLVGGAARSWFCIPLIAGSAVTGAFVGGHVEPNFFTENQLHLAETLATQTAIAIQNGQLFHQVQKGQLRLRQLAEQLVNMQEAERQRISRELHDEAGQALNALKVSLSLVIDDLPPDLTQLREQIKDASDIAEQTLRRIRLISYDLRPPELDTLGLNEALEAYCEEFAQRTRLTIRYEGAELPGLIDAIRISLYRFLQEGLTNVVKHAEAKAVDVRLSYDGQEVCLTISDDGRGFMVPARVGSNNASLGLGLLGMKERLAQLSGSLTIQSRLGEGTDLIACAPWEGPSLLEGTSLREDPSP